MIVAIPPSTCCPFTNPVYPANTLLASIGLTVHREKEPSTPKIRLFHTIASDFITSVSLVNIMLLASDLFCVGKLAGSSCPNSIL